MRRCLKFTDVCEESFARRRVAETYLDGLAEDRSHEVGVNVTCRLANSLSVGEGFCEDFRVSGSEDGPLLVVVGTGGLSRKSGLFSFVDNLSIAKATVAVCHEVAHIRQFMDEQTVDSDEMQMQSIEHAATLKNPRFYHVYYSMNKREMRAERQAISAATKYLVPFLDDDVDAEKLMLEYVAWRTLPDEVPDGPDDHATRVVSPKYFIPPARTPDGYYKSLDDVFSAFDEAIGREYSGQYCTNMSLRPQDGYRLRDEYIRVMEPQVRAGDARGKWFDTFNQFQDAPDQLTSYRMLACLTCYLNPDYKKSFGNLAGMDLSPEAVFGHGFPESADEVNGRLADGVERLDKVWPRRKLPGWMEDLFNRSERGFDIQLGEGEYEF